MSIFVKKVKLKDRMFKMIIWMGLTLTIIKITKSKDNNNTNGSKKMIKILHRMIKKM